MDVVILAGGMGTRMGEETARRPKPMVEVGGRPILWHIMNIYAAHGHRDFTIALGYKGEVVKEYFLSFYHQQSDLVINLRTGEVKAAAPELPDWTVSLVDTGANTMTGGRLWRLRNRLRSTFMLTYGDGVSNVDLGKLVAFHRLHGKLATVTAVRPVARFGNIRLGAGDEVREFKEKPQTGEGWINGGFFVFEPGVFRYLDGDDNVLEGAPLEGLARDSELMAYRHSDFWHCMDTTRDRDLLDKLWAGGEAPWWPEALRPGAR